MNYISFFHLAESCKLFEELHSLIRRIPIKHDLSLTSDLRVDEDSYMRHWQCATCSLFPDGPVDLFPASPSCCLPAIPTFDLCYLALIFRGVSKAVIEGDGVNIRDWHFSVIWHHRQHISVQPVQVLVLWSSPLDFTASVRRQRTENAGNSFSFLQLNMINCFIAKSLNVRKKDPPIWEVVTRHLVFLP